MIFYGTGILLKLHYLEKRRQPLTPSRRQHDTADGEGLVFNLRLQIRITQNFIAGSNVVFISPHCVDHI